METKLAESISAVHYKQFCVIIILHTKGKHVVSLQISITDWYNNKGGDGLIDDEALMQAVYCGSDFKEKYGPGSDQAWVGNTGDPNPTFKNPDPFFNMKSEQTLRKMYIRIRLLT